MRARICAQGPRLFSGQFLARTPLRGLGKLKIENDLTKDVVVQLVQNRKTKIAVYIRSGRDYTVTKIPDGLYGIFWVAGTAKTGSLANATGWDRKLLRVMCPAIAKRHKDKLEFTTEDTPEGPRGMGWVLRIYVAPGSDLGSRSAKPPPLSPP